jgi:uncharacterized protein
LRPLPNSPVVALTDEESAKVLKAAGDIRLGMVVGYKNVVVGIPSDQKSVLPRHTAVKITDPQVVADLRRTVSGIDDGLWKRLSGLAAGQAIVSFSHMPRPLLVAVDPAPAELRLVD